MTAMGVCQQSPPCAEARELESVSFRCRVTSVTLRFTSSFDWPMRRVARKA
jgi:hypothetical protein